MTLWPQKGKSFSDKSQCSLFPISYHRCYYASQRHLHPRSQIQKTSCHQAKFFSEEMTENYFCLPWLHTRGASNHLNLKQELVTTTQTELPSTELRQKQLPVCWELVTNTSQAEIWLTHEHWKSCRMRNIWWLSMPTLLEGGKTTGKKYQARSDRFVLCIAKFL